jgi:hypothetical protein
VSGDERIELFRKVAGELKIDLQPWQLDVLEQLAQRHQAGAGVWHPGNRNRELRRVDGLRVIGRPAPQGSKRTGMSGQMIEQSPYLIGWAGGWKGGKARGKRIHGAVERDLYQWYSDHEVDPAELPYLRGAVGVEITFYLDPKHGPITDPPDVDKLCRSTFDALTAGRLWEDDGRAIDVVLRKRPAMLPFSYEPGALIRAWEIGS